MSRSDTISGTEITVSSFTRLLDLPDEVLIEHLLPCLSAEDLAVLSAVCKRLYDLANDETLWQQLTQAHHNLSPQILAPPTPKSGWSKRVYLGLQSSQVLVWGSSDNGRLGVDLASLEGGVRRFRNIVGRPVEVGIRVGEDRTWRDGLRDSIRAVTGGRSSQEERGEHGKAEGEGEGKAGIVDLQAGGWSFAARDLDGGVWVWGQMDGTRAGFYAPTWSNKHAQVPGPTRLRLPCIASSICLGRQHLLILDEDNLIWELTAYGRAHHHTSTELTAPAKSGSRPRHIKQISAGWSHSACLTSKGDIVIWYPFTDAYSSSLTPDDQLMGPVNGEANATSLKWGTVGDVVVTLEPVPLRPSLDVDESSGIASDRQELRESWKVWEESVTSQKKDDGERVVKIASGIDFLLALKENGEVWIRRVKGDATGRWVFLPFFSKPGITHITAQYLALTSYSSTSLNHARLPQDYPSLSESTAYFELVRPATLPGFDGKRIIQVASGDYHDIALTAGGEVWTWGQGASGQLGRAVEVSREDGLPRPGRVVFPGEEGARETRKFAFAVTAGGWHTGALLLGDPAAKRQATRVKSSEVVKEAPPAAPDWPDSCTGPNLPIPGAPSATALRGGPMFRVGFAGRGSAMGMLPQRNWQARSESQ